MDATTCVVSRAARWLLMTGAPRTTLRPFGTLHSWKVTWPGVPKPRITIGLSVSLRKVMSVTSLLTMATVASRPVG